MSQGGIKEALSHAATIPPTLEHITQYQTALAGAIETRIALMNIEVLRADQHINQAARILREMPLVIPSEE